MFGAFIAAVVGYYTGLYSYLWIQLKPKENLRNGIVPTGLIKYKQL